MTKCLYKWLSEACIYWGMNENLSALTKCLFKWLLEACITWEMNEDLSALRGLFKWLSKACVSWEMNKDLSAILGTDHRLTGRENAGLVRDKTTWLIFFS